MKRAIVVLALILLTITGCNFRKSNDANIDRDSAVKIGFIGPLSGDTADWGIMAQRTMELALKNTDSTNIKIIYEDSRGETAEAVKAGQKLINIDKVGILTTVYSSETMALAPIAERAKTLLLSGTSSSPDITNVGDYVFRTRPSDELLAKAMADYAKRYEKVGIIAEQSNYSQSYANLFEKYYQGEAIRKDFLPSETDFKTIIASLGQNVDAVFISPDTNKTATLILEQLSEFGWDKPIMSNENTSWSLDLLKANKEFYTNKLVYVAFVAPDAPEFQKFLNEYRTAYEEDPPYPLYATSTYDAITVLSEAIKAVGNGSTAIKDYLYTHEFQSRFGYPIKFDENGDMEEGTYRFFVFNGKEFAPQV